jgi:hypothetical protein
MPHPNYTALDLTGAASRHAAFAAVLVPPGYVLAWATNLAKFRALDARWRFLLSVPLGIAVCPITIYLLDFAYPPLGCPGSFLDHFHGAVVRAVRPPRQENRLASQVFACAKTQAAGITRSAT